MNGSIKRIIDYYLEESIEGKKRKSLFQEVINGRGTHQIDDTMECPPKTGQNMLE